MSTLWQKLSDFLHKANLIPLVVVVSTYHYYQALRSHDPFFIALPLALFVDLLHFRTVQRAVRSGEAGWQATAVFTTLLTFGLQYMFYSQPSDSGVLGWWQVILFASIVPVGLAIMAWHHQRQEQETVIDWQQLITSAQQEAAAVQAQARETQQRSAAVQQQADELQRQAETEQARARWPSTTPTCCRWLRRPSGWGCMKARCAAGPNGSTGRRRRWPDGGTGCSQSGGQRGQGGSRARRPALALQRDQLRRRLRRGYLPLPGAERPGLASGDAAGG
jgi:hypothetical protein